MDVLLLLFIVYILIGFVAGIIGGLLGIGGGTITVPCFFIIFKLTGYPQAYLMPLAVGTSLAAIVFNTSSATWAHHREKTVKWEIFKKMAPGLVMGSIFGATLTIWLPEMAIEIFFGIFLCCLSIVFFRQELPHYAIKETIISMIIRLASFVIGTLSSILGIGGGVLTVPLLFAVKTPAKNAIGTSSAITLLVASLGTIWYFIFGWKHHFGFGNFGYINIPASLTVGIVAFLTAPLGAELTRRLPLNRIRKIFAFVLIFTGLTFISLNLLH
jgi:uncharacterized protein